MDNSDQSATNKIIINFCPTGMVPTKKMTPHVPVSVAEIVEDVHRATEYGITIAHLHARDADEQPDWRPETYRDIFEGVKKHCPGLIICGSTSGRKVAEFERRSAVIELMPDMCSLTLSSLNFARQASLNAPDMVSRLAEKMEAFGVIPELEAFDLGMINYGKYLQQKGVLKPPYYWNLLFGNVAGMQADAASVGLAASLVPSGQWISLGGLGQHQLAVHGIAAALGFGVRIGLEDNTWFDSRRTIMATNTSLLERLRQLMDIHELEPMTPGMLRQHGFSNKLAASTHA